MPACATGETSVSPTGESKVDRAEKKELVAELNGVFKKAAGVGVVASAASDSHTLAQASVHTPATSTSGSSGSGDGGGGALATNSATTGTRGAVTVRQSTTVAGVGSDGSASRSGASIGAHGVPGEGATAQATVSMGVVTGVGVELMATQHAGDVIADGAVSLRNAPSVPGLRILDGSLAVQGESGSAQASTPVGQEGARHLRGEGGFTVQSGIVLLGAPDGRRWRARVDGGELRCTTDGTAPGGRTVFVPSSGSLDVFVIAEGGADLSLAVGTSISSHAHTSGDVATSARTTALSTRAVTALNRLLESVPARSPDALRLASAVSLVMDQAQSADPRFYDTPIVGRSVVFVVDVSYSMGDLDPGATDLPLGRSAMPRKLDVARAELVKVLASVPSGVSVNVVAFSSGVQTLWTATRGMDDASLNAAIDWIANLRPEDETEPVSALRTALGMSPEQLVLLSDGRPSYRAPVTQEVMSLTASFSASVRLDVVGIGADQDTELLNALASRGHGTLRQR